MIDRHLGDLRAVINSISEEGMPSCSRDSAILGASQLQNQNKSQLPPVHLVPLRICSFDQSTFSSLEQCRLPPPALYVPTPSLHRSFSSYVAQLTPTTLRSPSKQRPTRIFKSLDDTMAARMQMNVGSASWIKAEKENVTQLLEQEKEELIYPAQHEMEWLNEHMAEIFSKSHL